jgi:hypothetical protein
MSEVQRIPLSQGWSWKQRDISLSSVLEELNLPLTTQGTIQEGWTTAQAFPSEIHVELLKKALIPDPYLGFNEHKVQCKHDPLLDNLNYPKLIRMMQGSGKRNGCTNALFRSAISTTIIMLS